MLRLKHGVSSCIVEESRVEDLHLSRSKGLNIDCGGLLAGVVVAELRVLDFDLSSEGLLAVFFVQAV